MVRKRSLKAKLNAVPERLLGRAFGVESLEVVREQVREAKPANRSEVARRVCAALQWRSPGGVHQTMSARVALLRLHRLGLITLPTPRSRGNNEKRRLGVIAPSAALPALWQGRVDELRGLKLQLVEDAQEAKAYRRLLQEYHYLGYSATAGAQVRYLIVSERGVLGGIGFGASAWKVQARDRWIGWSEAQRRTRLHLIINNTRFLIVPWVRCANLGSKVLALCARRLGKDFNQRYGYTPLLMETFVQRDRFTGGVYRAANWRCLGQTQGRGRNSLGHTATLPIKSVWVYPLTSSAQQTLKSDAS